MTAAATTLCFLSGITGLAYEVLWAKYLSIYLGSTALAQTTVLAAFLGGLALGSWLLGARADRAARPLGYYGSLELGVAFFGLASPALFGLAGRALEWASAGGHPALDAALRLCLGGATVLLPAILMGGTLPALARTAAGDLASGVSRLYAANCAGAVLGSLAAGFLLIPWLGLDGSIYVTAALDAAIGFAALGLARGIGPAAPAPAPARASAGKPDQAWPVEVVALAVFMSGFVSLGYELSWIRLLALVMGSSVYSFSVMLAAFISGIALGSLVVRRALLRRLGPGLLFGLAELGAAAAILATLPGYERLPYYFLVLSGRLAHGAGSFYVFEAVKFLFCFLLMLLPTSLLGMTLPLASALADPERERVGGSVGTIFAANTLGNVLGAVAGLRLLPWLGIEGLMLAGTTVNIAIGLAALWIALPWTSRRKAALAGAVLAAAAFYRRSVPPWNPFLFAFGGFRGRPASIPTTFGEFHRRLSQDGGLLFYRDDKEATVSVVYFRDGTVSLKVNGKTDASTGEDMHAQIVIGELPLLLKPEAKDVFLVGWGSGVTAGSILRHPVERLDVAEISRAVVDASRYFRRDNGDALEDARLHLSIEDAKTFLRRSQGRYDAIVSEPSNPWMAGVGSLFTSDFYRDARRHLKPGGLMVQWFHLYEMDDSTARLIMRTFASEFPHVAVWSLFSTDALIVGSDAPIAPDFELMEKAFARRAVFEDLKRSGSIYLTTLLSLQTASDAAVRAMAGPGPVNEDRFPRLEYEAPKAFYFDRFSRVVNNFDERAKPREERDLLLDRYVRHRKSRLTPREYMDMLIYPHGNAEAPVVKGWIDDWARDFPRDGKAYFARYMYEKFAGQPEAALASLRKAMRLEPGNPRWPPLEKELVEELRARGAKTGR